MPNTAAHPSHNFKLEADGFGRRTRRTRRLRRLPPPPTPLQPPSGGTAHVLPLQLKFLWDEMPQNLALSKKLVQRSDRVKSVDMVRLLSALR